MKVRIEPIQVALLALALGAGVLLDRLWFVAGNASRIEARSQSTSSSQTAKTSAEVAATKDEYDDEAPPSQAATSKKSLDDILAGRDPRQRTRELEAFINSLGPGDFGAALKRIRQITSSNERELASRLLVAHWVQADPDGALQFAAGNRGYEYVADDVFQQLATSDVESALARANAIPNHDLRYMALRGVLSFITDTDPVRALGLAQTFGEFRGQAPLSGVIYRQWAANDPQAAALQAAQDTDTRGWRSPVGQVMGTWAGQDPAAAANWSLSLNNPESQARSLGQIMRQWGREDPTAAVNWLNGLPSGASHDAAVAGLAYSMASTDPHTAISWIQTMSDETARNNALERVSRQVMWRDPKNGAAILQSAGVPPNLIPQPRDRPPRR